MTESEQVQLNLFGAPAPEKATENEPILRHDAQSEHVLMDIEFDVNPDNPDGIFR